MDVEGQRHPKHDGAAADLDGDVTVLRSDAVEFRSKYLLVRPALEDGEQRGI